VIPVSPGYLINFENFRVNLFYSAFSHVSFIYAFPVRPFYKILNCMLFFSFSLILSNVPLKEYVAVCVLFFNNYTLPNPQIGLKSVFYRHVVLNRLCNMTSEKIPVLSSSTLHTGEED
jgi:hypothetical protein